MDVVGLSSSAAAIAIFLERLEGGLADLVPLCDHDTLLKFSVISVAPAHYGFSHTNANAANWETRGLCRAGVAQASIKLSMGWGRGLGASVMGLTATAHRSQTLFRDKFAFRPLRVCTTNAPDPGSRIGADGIG